MRHNSELTANTCRLFILGESAPAGPWPLPPLPSSCRQPALADRISTPIAEFTGLDKITGRIISFDVYIGETVQFGTLQITPRVCYMRTPEEQPQTNAFVEVKEVKNGANGRSLTTIFSSWMFAESPAMNAVDHPVYDVWLTSLQDLFGRAAAGQSVEIGL